MTDTEESYLENLTGYWLKQAYFAVLSNSDKSLASLGISTPQFTILAVIDLNPGIIQSRLVERLYISRSTSSELIEKLVQSELLVRKAIDRRSSGLYLTKAGEQLLSKAKSIVQKLDKDVTVHMTAAEVKTLNNLLKKLATR